MQQICQNLINVLNIRGTNNLKSNSIFSPLKKHQLKTFSNRSANGICLLTAAIVVSVTIERNAINRIKLIFYKLGVNFINVLRTVFMPTDPNSVKKY